MTLNMMAVKTWYQAAIPHYCPPSKIENLVNQSKARVYGGKYIHVCTSQGFIQDFRQGGANVVITGLRGGNNDSSIFRVFLSERENYSTQLN